MILTTYIYQQTQSATYAAIFPLIRMIAGLIAGTLTPILIERFSFSKLVFILPVIKTTLVILFTINFVNISPNIWILFAFAACISFLEGWSSPILKTVTPKIVDASKLIKANSLLSFSGQLIQILGYTFTGILVVKYSAKVMLIATCVILLISLFFLFHTRKIVKSKSDEQVTKSKVGQLKQGWVILWKNRSVRIVTLMDVIEGMAGAVWIGAITLVYVNEVLNRSEDWWGFINSSYYIGTIIGGILALMITKIIQRNLIVSMAVGSFLFGIFTLLYGVNSTPWVALALCVLMGPAYQIRDIAQQTIIQTSVNTNELPKIYASHGILTSTSVSLSIFLVGLISDFFGVRVVYIFAGIVVLLSSFLSFALLKLEKKSETVQESSVEK